jgi:hypothetical protein
MRRDSAGDGAPFDWSGAPKMTTALRNSRPPLRRSQSGYSPPRTETSAASPTFIGG